jgi:hypothetical protein
MSKVKQGARDVGPNSNSDFVDPRRARSELLKATIINLRQDARDDFYERQRRERNWISVHEICDTIGNSDSLASAAAVKTKIQSILLWILDKARDGYAPFDGGRSLLLLHPYYKLRRCWLQSLETAAPDAFVERKKLEAYLESSDREKIADAVIAHCWVPRVIADNILRLNKVERDWTAASIVPSEGRSPTSQAGVPKADRGKVPLVIKLLAEKFPIAKYPNGVPSAPEAPRKAMIRDLLDSAPALGGTLDEGTLKKAIDTYNESLGAHR